MPVEYHFQYDQTNMSDMAAFSIDFRILSNRYDVMALFATFSSEGRFVLIARTEGPATFSSELIHRVIEQNSDPPPMIGTFAQQGWPTADSLHDELIYEGRVLLLYREPSLDYIAAQARALSSMPVPPRVTGLRGFSEGLSRMMTLAMGMSPSLMDNNQHNQEVLDRIVTSFDRRLNNFELPAHMDSKEEVVEALTLWERILLVEE